MLLLAAILAAASPASTGSSAQALVRIVAPARASAAEWRQAPPQLRRETTIRGQSGERVPARLIEYQ